MPYTFVLTPRDSSQRQLFINTAQAQFSKSKRGYLLDPDGTSEPHATIVQFDCSEHLAFKIWNDLVEILKSMNFQSIAPPYGDIAYIEGKDRYKGTTWAEISIDRSSEDSPILQLHLLAVSILERNDLEPLNACRVKNYRPHLTLARIDTPQEKPIFMQSFATSTGETDFEFGMSDSEWQYAIRIATYPNKV